MLVRIVFFLCKQKTAYEMRISDWSSDVCSSDLMLEPLLNGCGANTPGDTTEENIQAHSRGITLMAISNRLGYMVLSTGNESAVSVGYATLYGDMVGGFNVLKDLYKTLVFDLSRWRNQVLPKGALGPAGRGLGSASCRERVGQKLEICEVDVLL